MCTEADDAIAKVRAWIKEQEKNPDICDCGKPMTTFYAPGDGKPKWVCDDCEISYSMY